MDSVVQRLHRALAEALQRRRPDIEAAPVTVAEIYQELVPYRNVRASVGFEMNADYEHALLRLLSGEDALVRLEPEEVRQQLERELRTPNPDVTLFRRFAACDVWVSPPVPRELSGSPGAVAAEDEAAEEDWTPAWLEAAAREIMEQAPPHRAWTGPDEAAAEAPAGAAAAPPPPPEPEPARAQAAAPTHPPEHASFPPVVGAGPPEPEPEEPPLPSLWSVVESEPEPERELPRAEPSRMSAHCPFCHAALPPDRPVRYCPFCGVDQQLRPCPRCGEILEPGWRYCVSCGAPSPVGAA